MLNPCKLGLAGGIVSGLFLAIITLIGLSFPGYAHNWYLNAQQIYVGYSVSLPGAVVGLIYGFVEGFIFFYALGFIYNRLCSSCCCK